MNTILTDDERPKLPEAQKYRRQQRHDGGYELVPAYTQEEMEAYADAREAAVLAKLREQQPVYAYIYEWDSELGIHQSLSPASWNGKLPKRTVSVYAAPQPAVVQVPQGWIADLRIAMEHSAWDGVLQLPDALANIDDAAAMLAAAPEASATAVSEREAFEAHEQAKHKHPNDGLTRYPDAPDQYALPLMQARWEGWQARAALEQQPSLPADVREVTTKEDHVLRRAAALSAKRISHPLPTDVREAIKVAREALMSCGDEGFNPGLVISAIARLDALGGGE